MAPWSLDYLNCHEVGTKPHLVCTLKPLVYPLFITTLLAGLGKHARCCTRRGDFLRNAYPRHPIC